MTETSKTMHLERAAYIQPCCACEECTFVVREDGKEETIESFMSSHHYYANPEVEVVSEGCSSYYYTACGTDFTWVEEQL